MGDEYRLSLINTLDCNDISLLQFVQVSQKVSTLEAYIH